MRARSISLRAGLALALLAACGAPPPSVIKTTSVPKPPAWLTKPPTDGGALYFSGTKSGAESLEDGKQAALDKARAEAAKFIGVTVSAEHTDVMSTDLASDQVKDTTQSRTVALIKNAALADVYWEKNSRQAGATTIDRFDVSVLIKLSRGDLEAERKRQEDEGRATVNAAFERLREGQAKEREGDLLAALARYRDVAATLKPLPANIDTGDALVKTSGAVRHRAEELAAQAQKKARRALLAGPDWVVGAITQALTKAGFSAAPLAEGTSEQQALAQARAQGVPWVIVAKATSVPGGRVFSKVAAQATLDVRALETSSGTVAASTQKTEKGFGNTAEAAQADAASQAGQSAGKELAAALVAKESAGL